MNRTQTFLAVAVPTTLAGIGAATTLIPNTVLLDKYKQFTRSYNQGLPVPVSPSIHKLILEVKNDLMMADNLKDYNVTPEKINNIKPFSCFGFELFRLGWVRTSYGALIGIPEYFAEKDISMSALSKIRVAKESVNWDTPEGKQLKDSFKLSDEAKKFVIAREMLHLCEEEVISQSAINAWHGFVGSIITIGCRHKFKLDQKPKLLSGIVYLMIATYVVGSWFLYSDSMSFSRDVTVDNHLCSMSHAYALGGCEYYYSIVKRNMALRSLLGEYGEKKFNTLGNHKTLIRLPHASVTDRAECCRDHLKEYIRKNDSEVKPE